MASNLTPEQVQYYEDHAYQDRQPNLYAAAACGLILSWIAVVLRCLARRKSRAKFGKDDWLCIASLVSLWWNWVTKSEADKSYRCHLRDISCHSLWTHITVPASTFSSSRAWDRMLRWAYLVQIARWIFGTDQSWQSWITGIVAYNIATSLNKISILYFYTRVFPIRPMIWIRRGLSLWIIMYSLALMFVGVFECIPLSSMWSGKKGHCINAKVPYVILRSVYVGESCNKIADGDSVVNVVTDFVILALPLYFVIPLQMTLVRKIQVCGIFLTGGVYVVPRDSRRYRC